MDSYSENGEDLELFRLVRRSARFGVDVGAYDGRIWSNSFLFGQMGYRLLLVEPLPQYAEKCRRLYNGRRDVLVENVAIGQQAGEQTFHVQAGDSTNNMAMRSSLHPEFLPLPEKSEIRVQVSPLRDLLAKHQWPKRYAFLTIDAEGADLDVLETASLDRWRPHAICVEEGHWGMESVPKYLAQFHYRRVLQRGPNSIYLSEEPGVLRRMLRALHMQTA